MSVLGYLQRIGRALMVPVAVLPAAAIMMGVGYWLDPNGWGADSALAAFLIQAGAALIDKMAILFAIGVAYGMSKDKDGAAALAGLVGYLVVTTLLKPNVVAQIQSIPLEQVPAAFKKIDARPAPIALHNASLSAAMCQSGGSSACGGMFDREYFEEMVAKPFREGTIGEAPVLPGTGLFMPAGTAGSKDKGLFRRAVPIFNPDVCTGCMECALVCPDAAIPNSVHDIHELLLTGISTLDITEAQREAMRGQIYAVAEAVRESYRQSKEARAFHELVAEAAARIPARRNCPRDGRWTFPA